MSAQTVRVQALTPLLFRDARPFSANSGESRATSLLLPPPSAIAGLLRTAVGDTLGWDWRDPRSVEAAAAVRLVRFHFECTTAAGTTQVVPAPRTAILHAPPDSPLPSVMRLAPTRLPDGCGHDAPAGLLPLAVTNDVKPLPGYQLWAWPDLRAWLGGRDVVPRQVPEPAPDERVQIAIDPRRGAADDGMLFTAQYRSWDGGDNAAAGEHSRWSLVAALDGAPPLTGEPQVAHFGGERRPVVITGAPDAPAPTPDADLLAALTSSTRVTLQLLTPGLFDGGWRPGWVQDPSGLHPSLSGARLLAAAVGRPETVSGWSYEAGRRGPKATRWAAPAGSTFFLELPRRLTDQDVSDLWLTSVSDHETDRSDGYGLAVWGVWN